MGETRGLNPNDGVMDKDEAITWVQGNASPCWRCESRDWIIIANDARDGVAVSALPMMTVGKPLGAQYHLSMITLVCQKCATVCFLSVEHMRQQLSVKPAI